jgi:hypothetical protein
MPDRTRDGTRLSGFRAGAKTRTAHSAALGTDYMRRATFAGMPAD